MIRCGKKSNGDLWFQFMFCALILQPHEPFVCAIRMFDLLFNSATCSCHSHYQQHSFHFSNPIHSHNLLEAKDSIGSCKLRWVAQTSSLFPPSWNHHGTHRGGTEAPLICMLSLCHPWLHYSDSNSVPCTSCRPHLEEAVLWLCIKQQTA